MYHWIVYFKMIKVVNFVLYVKYIIKKNKKIN